MSITSGSRPVWRDYLELCKFRVVGLMLITAWVGMLLASDPKHFPFYEFIIATIGIGLAASSAAVINHLVEMHSDKTMRRTQNRPLVQGRVRPKDALIFSLVIGSLGIGLLYFLINPITAILTFITQLSYALIYTLYLKRATPQNIVIGGIAGATPPLLGWTAVTDQISGFPLLLVLIIFIWTPPHFWALAIYRLEDYKSSGLPMLPVTHGVPYTKLNILLYTFLLVAVTALPFATGYSGWLYFILVMASNLWFLVHAIRLMVSTKTENALATFKFSIWYLLFLFIALMLDHYQPIFAGIL